MASCCPVYHDLCCDWIVIGSFPTITPSKLNLKYILENKLIWVGQISDKYWSVNAYRKCYPWGDCFGILLWFLECHYRINRYPEKRNNKCEMLV